MSDIKILIVLLIVLLFFGSSRLPKLSRSIGESARELKGAFTGSGSSSDDAAESKTNKKA